jgi:hypothetical protein
MRQAVVLPKGERLVCGACGLPGYPPMVIKCAKLKGERDARVRCSNVSACAKRVRFAERRSERATGTR